MDLAMEAFKMAGALVVVLMIMGGALWVAKQILGQQRGNAGTPELQFLGGLRLGPGKSVVLVDIAGEVLVLGATSKELTLLTRVNDPDRVNRLRPQASVSFPRLHAWSGSWWGMTMSKRSEVTPEV